MLLPTTREENLYASRKSLVTRHFNLSVPEPDVCFNAWIVNNGSSCISPRISDQSYTIHSDSLHADNNWTARKLLISFSVWSNVTSQHNWQDEKLTGQIPNQSGHCPLTGRYLEPWMCLALWRKKMGVHSVLLTEINRQRTILIYKFLSCK